MNITINIQAPELSKAIEALAAALSSTNVIPTQSVLERKRQEKQMQEAAKKETEKPADESQPDTSQNEETAATTESKEEAPSITLEIVRAALAKLSQSGKQAQVKELIQKVGGAKKLTDVQPGKYAELLAAAEKIA